MNKFLIVGSGGRESAFAISLAKDSQVFAVIGHANPTIMDCVTKSGGQYSIDNASDPQVVLRFAQKHNVDYVFVSADDPLANGVVDALLDNDIKAIGGTKDATRIEWDKIYSIEMVNELCPEYTPFFTVISQENQLQSAIKEFQSKNLQVVVKPQGLTGGKGVKVMPEHLKTYDDAIDYAKHLLESNPGEQVLLVEKLEGVEFTIMGLTDGENLVLAPASYDYPFRLENDLGAGTGGMGCFTASEKKLPFMEDSDIDACKHIMQRVIDKMRQEDLFFNGVLNGGFFKTAKGIKFMEFNGRFGDPEALNVLSVLDGSFSQLLENIWTKNLTGNNVNFLKKASVIKYLVAEEYPNPSPESLEFTVDEESIEAMGITLFYASCTRNQSIYKTLKKSRVVALGAVSDEITTASDLINSAIEKFVQSDLEYRQDIGSAKSLNKLMNTKNQFCN